MTVLCKKLRLMQLRGLPDDGVGKREPLAYRGDGGEAQIVGIEMLDLPAAHRVDGAFSESLSALHRHPLVHLINGD